MSKCCRERNHRLTPAEEIAVLWVLFVVVGLPTLMVVVGLLTNIPAVDAFLKGQP